MEELKEELLETLTKMVIKQSQDDKKDGVKFIKVIDVYRALARFIRENL